MSAYDELGGLPSTIQPPKTSPAEPEPSAPPAPHVHSFHIVSGWCGCGTRDDGKTDS